MKKIFIFYIPTMLSLFAVCLGITAVKCAFENSLQMAAILLLSACFLDGIDGRIARALGVSSDFGAQIDSLADAINFGVAPGLIIYFWKLQELEFELFAWFSVLLLICCMVIRLARFNADLTTKDQESPLVKYFFRGMPAPAVASMVIFPLVLSFQFGESFFFTDPLVVSINTIFFAIFAGSVVPTPCFKKLHFTGTYNIIYKAIFYLLVFLIIVKPWLGLSLTGIVYLITVVIAIYMYKKIKQQY
jgi:CDP-diacylglycerol--serine O-phosphatidyltransferase